MASNRDMAILINRFITSTHPQAPLSGQGEMIVRVGNRYGVDPRLLAAIARKETEFGSTSGKYRFNPGMWGVHLGPSVNTSRSWEEGFTKIAKGLAGGLYKGTGLTTPSQILMRYAPPSDNNNTALYIDQVNGWMRQMGADPNRSVFGAPTVAPPSASPASVSSQYAQATAQIPGGGIVDKNRLMMLLENQRRRSLRGIMPAAGFMPELMKLAQTALPASQTVLASREAGRRVTSTGDTASAASVSVAAPPKPSGGWNGAEGPAMQMARLAARSGLSVTSAKRSRRGTASGGVSDHWSGSTSSYAVDLGWGGERPTGSSDEAASRIVRALGGPRDWGRKGGNFTTTVNGLRWQVIYRSDVGGNHWNHIHVGVKRV